MPEPGYEGSVKFRALVQRGARQVWEEATPIEVNIVQKGTSSSTQGPNNNIIITKTVRPLTAPTKQEDHDTTRWSSSEDRINSTTDRNTEDKENIFRESLTNVTKSYERLEAEHGGWDQARNGVENVPRWKLFFIVIYLLGASKLIEISS